jgi:hypothetical protein
MNKVSAMKRLFTGLILAFMVSHSFCQDINTLVKLNRMCVQLGSSRRLPADSLQLQLSLSKINIKTAQHLDLLLKAAENYLLKDYEHSSYYIQLVHMNFRNPEYNNLKLLLMICNFAHEKNIQETARHYYIIKKINLMEPGNMEFIHNEIAGNFERASFDKALSQFFYYHQRLKILDTIYNSKIPDIQ